jgi:ribosomal protein S18 acetylase RimI-like enzyme
MQFELTEALIDDILFSMEDQDGEYWFDTVEGIVSGGPDGLDAYDVEAEEDGGRYISLPEWDSASGFRLMERFAARFRNPLIREELSSALDHGKGVFRAFKNVLGRHPEAEKLWFSFKEREMKNEVINWYNGLREEWGLQKIGMEPEETSDLVLEDFRFRPFIKEDLHDAEELHSLCMEEHRKYFTESGAKSSSEILTKESQVFFYKSNSVFSEAALPNMVAIAAESGSGEFAGYISGIVKDSVLYIQTLEVRAEYRGLGIGEALLDKLLASLDPDEISQVLLDLPSAADGFSRVLLRESFKPYTVRYWLNLRDRLN